MPWLELTLPCTLAEQPRCERALEDLGALSVTMQDADAETDECCRHHLAEQRTQPAGGQRAGEDDSRERELCRPGPRTGQRQREPPEAQANALPGERRETFARPVLLREQMVEHAQGGTQQHGHWTC